MRIKLTILFLWVLSANATNYYVSNAGNDANAGTSTGTSWQHISKVNSSSFVHGDSIFFNRGDSWNEALRFPSSGISGSVIYIGAYGSGNNPLITGLQTVTGWTDSTGNFWVASFAGAAPNLNCVLINGVLVAKGRYPNKGQTIVTFPVGIPQGLLYGDATQFKAHSNNALPFNFVGGEIAARPNAFDIDVVPITAQSGDTLSFPAGMTFAPIASRIDFIIQNHINCLDTLTEWAYVNNKLYIYSSGSPSAQATTIDTLVNCHGKNYLTFSNINFSGANKTAISLDTLSHVTVQNCSFSNMGRNAIQCNRASLVTINNDSMVNCQNDAVFTSQYSDSITITNNYIKNCGKWYGMGSNGNDAYLGIFAASYKSNINLNRIDSVGFNGISFLGDTVTVRNDYISCSCLVKQDCGGIYTNNGVPQTGSKINSNIIINSIGYNYQPAVRVAAAIYLDGTSIGLTVDSNTINNAAVSALLLNLNRNITARENTIVDSLGDCITAPNGYAYSGISVLKNVFYQKNKLFETVNVAYGYTANEDSNYVLRPDSVADQLKQYINPTYSLAGWITATGMDSHTSLMPTGITSTVGTLYTNPTQSDSTIIFSGRKVDAKGNQYSGSVTIHPYQSALLFPAFSDNINIIGGIKIL